MHFVRSVSALGGGLLLLTAFLIPLGQVSAAQDSFNKSLDEEMSFYVATTGGNCAGCAWIAAEGRITASTPDRFKEFLQRNQHVRGMVHLNSPGGSLIGGLR